MTRDLRAGLSDAGIIAARNIPECKRELPKLEEAILLSQEGGQHRDPGHQAPRCREARVYRLRSAGSGATIWQSTRGLAVGSRAPGTHCFRPSPTFPCLRCSHG